MDEVVRLYDDINRKTLSCKKFGIFGGFPVDIAQVQAAIVVMSGEDRLRAGCWFRPEAA